MTTRKKRTKGAKRALPSVGGFFRAAHKAGHDALDIMHDPEALKHLKQVSRQKPPAHEVIVALLQKCAADLRQDAHAASCGSDTVTEPEIIEQQAFVLILALMRMHIPEKDRAAVVEVLHTLPSNFFSVVIANAFAAIEDATGGA